MSAPASDPTDLEPTNDRVGPLLSLGLASAVLFGAGLVFTESVGELALDVDFKPFFIPYLMVALAGSGISTLSIGLGAAVGEGVLDIFEGYELDDPIGFLGYVVGFAAFGWYLQEVAEDPESATSLAVAAVLGALVQAAFEGFAFLVFNPDTGPVGATMSVLGNTAIHGVVLGAIPLVALYPPVRDRVGSLP